MPRVSTICWIAVSVAAIALTVGVCYLTGRPQELHIETATIAELGGAADLDFNAIEQHLEQLSGFPSRVTGYHADQALAYIQDRLGAAGMTETATQTFEVPVPMVERATLSARLPGRAVDFEIHPVWPNLSRTSMTPAEGISGPLVDVGRGTDVELAGKDLRDAIVVVDWDSRSEWLSVPEFGGRAVLFRANSAADSTSALRKYLTVPANIPRFYVSEPELPLLDALLTNDRPTVTLRCEMEWKPVEARNLLVRVCPGRNPATPAETPQQPVVFHAYYDSISVVPGLAPGAEQACGAATLLEVARYFHDMAADEDRRPLRPVYALFTGAHGQSLQGMTHFVRTLKERPSQSHTAVDSADPFDTLGTPGLFVGLDLSSHSRRFGVFACGHYRTQAEHILRPKFSTLGLNLASYADEQTTELDVDNELPGFVDCINLTLGRGWWTYFPYRAPFESELPTMAGMPGITLGTINDARQYVDTPHDTFDGLRLDAFREQLLHEPGKRIGLIRIAQALAMWDGPFVSGALEDKFASLGGRVAWLDQEQNYTPDEPLTNAVVFLKNQRAEKHLRGTRGGLVSTTDADGNFLMDGLLRATYPWELSTVTIEAYGLGSPLFVKSNPDAVGEYLEVVSKKNPESAGGSIPTDGDIVYAADMARADEYPSTIAIRKAEQHLNLVVFPCKSVTLYGLTDPREYIDLTDIQILDAATQSPPFQYGQSTTDAAWWAPDENCITVWADPLLRVRLTFGFGFQKKRLVLLNNSVEEPVGKGYVLGDFESIPSMILQGASDMWNLDEFRLRKLETNGINNPRVQKLHAEAKDNLDAAHEALLACDYREYRRNSEKAWSLESKAYGELLSTTNNMIRGVLFYLLLLLPFSYCLERLLVAAGTIRNRILGMTTIFAISFFILAMVHPAFRFTMTPFIVLLAFVVLSLAGTVSMLLVGRFDGMLQEQKQAATGVHEDSTSVGNIAIRAIDLGIANIRRRARRGFLTGMTIVMVMFTLLSFVSIVPELNISKLRHPDGEPVYKGLLARDRGWNGLRLPVYDSLRRTFANREGGRAAVAARAWFYSDYSGQLSQIDLAPVDKGGSAAPAVAETGYFTTKALLCLEPDEPQITGVDRTLIAGRWFNSPDELGIILPLHIAECLGYGTEDIGKRVLLFGRHLPIIGIFDPEMFDELTDIDGEMLTPVDFVLQSQITAERGASHEEADTLEDYVHYGSDQIAIVPLKLGFRLGAAMRSVGVSLHGGLDPVEEAENFARRSSTTILASDGDRVTLFTSVAGSKLSAAGQIGVPVFLGFLMVLGTMLGSVYERRREIFVYNSVGLSPSHVASLFLAESSVYAVVGACVGFLLGQVVSKALMVTGVLSSLSLNYSAGSTVFVTALTMLIVLSSTIYPARQAFLAAIPESRRDSDALDEDESLNTDRISFFLPFVATTGHVFAMQAYMYEFLDSIQGVTVGQVAVDDLRVQLEELDGHPCPSLVFRGWLAPFDLGISHDVKLQIRYREDRGVYQYHLTAVRFSGDQQSWRRLTPRFVTTLRKQLLMWRILSTSDHERYAVKGAALYGRNQAVAETAGPVGESPVATST